MKSLLFYLLLIIPVLSSSAQYQKGLDIDGQGPGDWCGWSVSMPDKRTVALASIRNGLNGFDSGHTRVFQWVNQQWLQKGPDILGEAIGDWSGFSIDMPDKNTIAIGAINNAGFAIDAGHVRIYTWNGIAWVQKGIDIDGGSIGDLMGYSVSMPDNNTIAIGGVGNDVNGNYAGLVQVYTWNGSSWIQKGNNIYGEAANNWFGYDVNMPDINTLAIGATGNSGNGIRSGHVQIYSWVGGSWVQKGLDIDGETAEDLSGRSISMPDSNTIAIGSPKNGGAGFEAGHVRVFEWNGTTWSQKGTDIEGEAAGDWFGWSVSMSDPVTLSASATLNSQSLGHVRNYRWDGIDWVQKGWNIDGEAPGQTESGYSISMPSPDLVAIGAPYNNGNGIESGHVRIYDLCVGLHSIGTMIASTSGSYTSPSGNHVWTTSGSYQDTIRNIAGCDSIITVHLTVGNTTVNDHDLGSDFKISPNPTSGEITLSLNQEYSEVELVVRDPLGQEIQRELYASLKKFVTHLNGPSGVYLIEMKTDDGKTIFKKVVKE